MGALAAYQDKDTVKIVEELQNRVLVALVASQQALTFLVVVLQNIIYSKYQSLLVING